MSWFYEHRQVPSEVNGTIDCVRILGTWQIIVEGVGQSGKYLDTMWKQALRRVPNHSNIQKILILGLGIGSSIPAYYKRFRGAHVTIIEIDPVMIRLANEFRFIKQLHPEIRLGDANHVVPTLPGTYDLIVFDMFLGSKVAEITRHEHLIRTVIQKLNPTGSILVNAYQEQDVLDTIGKYCHEVRRWKYCKSLVGIFRPWGAGSIGDPLPSVYQHCFSVPAFMQREFNVRPGFKVITAGKVVGIHRHLPIFDFEHYLGEEEPKPIPKKTRARLTFWQPITRLDTPPGWRRWPVSGHRRLTGFSVIPEQGDYTQAWSDHAKRHIKRWRKQTNHEIIDTDVQTYLDAFATCGKRSDLINLFSNEIRRKHISHPNYLHLRIARQKTDGTIYGGFASLWIPELRQTFHVTSFITPAGRETSAAFGLVDDCFQIAQSRGDRVLEFDGFYAFGDPSSWKGFSKFKGQFGVTYIRWPRPLVRFD